MVAVVVVAPNEKFAKLADVIKRVIAISLQDLEALVVARGLVVRAPAVVNVSRVYRVSFTVVSARVKAGEDGARLTVVAQPLA